MSRLFDPGFTTAAMAVATSDEAWLAALLRFESALAGVRARRGEIPASAAEAIGAACSPELVDIDVIGRRAVAHASPVVPLVEALRAQLPPEAARHVHVPATSQDAVDTAMMLVVAGGLDVLLEEMAALAALCADLARRHRETPMLARTLQQPALAFTFGCKAATWLVAVVEARTGLRSLRRKRLAVQLGGPVGTLAGSPQGAQLVAALAAELGLAAPAFAWQSWRGRMCELGATLAAAAGAAGKIAGDVVLLAQAEVGEVSEAQPGGSSSMPHKRNAARAVMARAACAGVLQHAAGLLAAGAGEHERAAGAWQAEWPAVTAVLRLAAGTVARTRESLTGLQVDTARMASNLATLALAQAGAVSDAEGVVDAALEMYAASVR